MANVQMSPSSSVDSIHRQRRGRGRQQCSTAIRYWRSLVQISSMLLFLTAWRIQQGVSFAPLSLLSSSSSTVAAFILPPRPNRPSSYYRKKESWSSSLMDTDDPMSTSSTLISPSSTSLNATQTQMATTSTTTTPTIRADVKKKKSVPLRMPAETETTANRQQIPNNNKNNNNNHPKSSKYYVSPEDLARLQDSVDIVSLIECYGIPQFTKSSNDNRATCLCPFHDDRNPSLKIDGNRGIFKCFSCGMGGNALSFVREYAKVHNGNGQELSFLQAVKVLDDMVLAAASSDGSTKRIKPVLPVDIAVPMGARPSAGNVTITSGGGGSRSSGSTFKKTRKPFVGGGSAAASATTSTSRHRVLLANLHAAAYYEECLLTRIDAGAARTHIRSRNIQPSTVKTFAMGFAPETYFSTATFSKSTSSGEWGKGSLVQYLRKKGFRPQEIVDAGLATRTKRGKKQLEELQMQQQQIDNNSSSSISGVNATTAAAAVVVDNDYSTLMDRFRGRLVVPIFDRTGSHVLGFGGRILESVTSGSDFKAAKYLNSPESIIFQKKEVLFGQHLAEQSDNHVSKNKKSKSESTESERPGALIVVEGYMDAIALWQAGIRETVASMGTAISLEQLESAAGSARKLGVGKIVLCLDNDDAGVAAVERLCSGKEPLLLSATESSNIEVWVARLPESVKDPAEYLEGKQHEDLSHTMFRREVVDRAVEWTEWYIDRIIDKFNATANDDEKESFTGTFDLLASFLSVFEDSDRRAKTAMLMAERLTPLLGAGNDKMQGSVVTCTQLESDLLHKASIASRSSAQQPQLVFEISDVGLESSETRPIDIGLGGSLEISHDITDLEGRRERKEIKRDQPFEPESENKYTSRKPTSKRRLRMKRPKPVSRASTPMTPHIGGLKSGSLDDAWLRGSLEQGLSDGQHLRYEVVVEGSRIGKFKKNLGPSTSVRFNHNEYHGTWSSEEASMAGYTTSSGAPRNIDFLERGTSSLIEVSHEDVSCIAEDLLLRLLLRFVEARRSLIEKLRVSSASGTTGSIHWSQPEKEWLFECLVEGHDDIPAGKEGGEQLLSVRSYLINRRDRYLGAIGEIIKEHDDNGEEEEVEPQTLPSNDAGVCAADEPSGDHTSAATVTNLKSAGKESLSPGYVPSIGDEWMDFAELDGLNPEFGLEGSLDPSSTTISDEYLDSLPVLDLGKNGEEMILGSPSNEVTQHEGDDVVITPERIEHASETEASGTFDAEFVSSDLPSSSNQVSDISKGCLDYLFYDYNNDLDLFSQNDPDGIMSQRGDHNSKAGWAAQDLHTILQTSSVLHRVQAGRDYLLEQQTLQISEPKIGGVLTSKASSTLRIMNEMELAEYCSPHCSTGGLRDDLHLVRTLIQSNQRAKKRIHALMLAGFADSTAITRGYSWLTNVLRFNDMKMVQWNDIIESKDGFESSDERLVDLEEVVSGDWNELFDADEMWDWKKNVNLNHVSYIAQSIKGDEHPESTTAMSDRIEDEWGWATLETEDDEDLNAVLENVGADDESLEDEERTEDVTGEMENDEDLNVAVENVGADDDLHDVFEEFEDDRLIEEISTKDDEYFVEGDDEYEYEEYE